MPYPLYANTFTNKQFSDASMNHSLVGYLDNYRDKIASFIMNARSKAKNTNTYYERGLLNIQLTLTRQIYSNNVPNLDLHVFEPNNSHVYYIVNSSVNGQMEVYDFREPPFSLYHSKCNILEGNYTIKVNFFSNSIYPISSYQTFGGYSY